MKTAALATMRPIVTQGVVREGITSRKRDHAA